MTTDTKHEIPDAKAILFFHELKKQLPYSSTRKIVSLVRTILSKIRTSSSSQPIAGIKPETSSVLHLLSVSHQCGTDSRLEICHLDELVDALYLEDKNRVSEKQLFKSEIDALSIITKVLRKIEDLFNSEGTTAFNYTLNHEIQQASQEGIY